MRSTWNFNIQIMHVPSLSRGGESIQWKQLINPRQKIQVWLK